MDQSKQNKSSDSQISHDKVTNAGQHGAENDRAGQQQQSHSTPGQQGKQQGSQQGGHQGSQPGNPGKQDQQKHG